MPGDEIKPSASPVPREKLEGVCYTANPDLLVSSETADPNPFCAAAQIKSADMVTQAPDLASPASGSLPNANTTDSSLKDR